MKALREVMERGRGDALLAEAYDHAPDSRARRTGARAGVTGVTGDNGTSALVAISCADSDLRPSFEEYDVMEREVAAASPVFWPDLGQCPLPLLRLAVRRRERRRRRPRGGRSPGAGWSSPTPATRRRRCTRAPGGWRPNWARGSGCC
ncbi:hypothetical protein SALBM217S_08382 [Streptomyces griseoloalbus]